MSSTGGRERRGGARTERTLSGGWSRRRRATGFVRLLFPDWMPRAFAQRAFVTMAGRLGVRHDEAIWSLGVRSAGRRDKLTWKHVELMRRLWKGRLVLKGVLDPEDARIARESGVDGVIVSNHGGRQLDGALAPLRALPGVKAQAGSMTVMMDSGVRRGTDVLKALALGAQFVFVGRPFLYAAVVAGDEGVAHAIKLLREEIDRDMALIGIASLADMGAQRLAAATGAAFLPAGD